MSAFKLRSVLAVGSAEGQQFQFQSRHSDDQTPWAIYERIAQPGPLITHRTAPIHWDNYELRQAMEIHGLTWG